MKVLLLIRKPPTHLVPAMLKDLFFWGGMKGGQQLRKLSFWQRKCSIIARLSDGYLEHISNYKGRRKLTQNWLLYADVSYFDRFLWLCSKMNKQWVYCEEAGENKRLSCWSVMSHKISAGNFSQRCWIELMLSDTQLDRKGLQLGQLPKRFYH